MKKMTYFVLSVFMLIFTLVGCSNSGQTSQSEKETGETKESTVVGSTASQSQGAEKHHIKINIKEYGSISVELDTASAPITVENFMKLIKDKFYDGLTFHRIISGFMIQGGDPLGTGLGGAEQTIKGEFSSNGVDNSLSHTRGAISMARSAEKDSASSQFFIVQEDSTHLDGEYAAFGYVTDGMDVVDKICQDIQVEDKNGTVIAANQPIIESIEIVD